MLYPQHNACRQVFDLSGFWDFRFDPNGDGALRGWETGFDEAQPIAVPASWNDQFEQGRDYLGDAWYQTRFERPWGWESRRVFLRFGSVNYLAEVWLNGQRLGLHEGGHLPFSFEITPHLRASNRLVVRVEGRLAPDRVPPGNIPYDPRDAFGNPNYPPASFDFFPFCGIHRPVLLYAVPSDHLTDITVTTQVADKFSLVTVKADCAASSGSGIRFDLRGFGASFTQSHLAGDSAETQFTLNSPALWSPEAPNLYELTVELTHNHQVIDCYSLPVGIRSVAVEGETLLLNGQPILLKGFGRHEDFPVTGRGLLPPLIIKDYALMRWIGANSFRTSHYPYSEQMMQLADRLGILVIDETPAVGLFFNENGLQRRLDLLRQQMTELIARDKNHPSVIMWSMANEPHSRPAEGRASARLFFREIYDLAKKLDPTRPVTLVSHVGVEEESFAFCDVMCLNRYYGWYTESGRLDEGAARLEAELDALHATFPNKPLILSEFGADALSGWHAQPPEMFSEEYQAEMLTRYIQILNRKSFVVGQHVWNMCDFKTAQAVHRMMSLNLKGVFTRDRRPKLAAHRLRALWTGQNNPDLVVHPVSSSNFR